MKDTFNYCKLQVIFKNKTKLSNMFRFKDVYFMIQSQEWFTNTRVVDAVHLIMVRQRGT